VLFIGTGLQRNLCTALELGKWPVADNEAPGEQQTGGVIEVKAQKTTMINTVMEWRELRQWKDSYRSSDVIVFVMKDSEDHALDTWESVILDKDAILAKCIPVVLTSGKSGDAVSARLDKNPEGVVTMRELVYVRPRNCDGLDQLRDSICRGSRRRDNEARAPVMSVPETSPAPVSSTVVAPSPTEAVTRNRVSV